MASAPAARPAAGRNSDDLFELRALHVLLQSQFRDIVATSAVSRARAAQIRARSRDLLSRSLRVGLSRDPACAAHARGLMEEHFAQLPERVLDDAKTVVSELVTHAYRHGEGPIILRVRERSDRFRIDVSTQGPPEPLDVGPRDRLSGLGIVDRLSERWGILEGSNHVWADVRHRA